MITSVLTAQRWMFEIGNWLQRTDISIHISDHPLGGERTPGGLDAAGEVNGDYDQFFASKFAWMS